MLGGVVFNDRKRSRFYDPGEGVGGVVISTGTAKTKSWKSGAYVVELPESKAKLTVELEGEKYTSFLPDGKNNVKFDVIVSDLPVFKRVRKLLEAAEGSPRRQRDRPVQGAAGPELGHPGHVDRGRHSGGESHRWWQRSAMNLDKDKDTVRQAVSGDASQQAAKDVQAVARKYSHTKAKAWFDDAASCVKMNATYLRMKAMHEGKKPMPASMIDRTIKDQQKKLAKLTAPEWRKVGAELIANTSALGEGGGSN